MRFCIANALRLWRDATKLGRLHRPQGCNILALLAAEEAAKVLILFDALRCPRQPQAQLVRHLRTFNQHLARGLYAWCYDARLLDVAELRRAGRIYDKLAGFIEDMESLGNRLNQAQNSHQQAMSKLSSGRGNLVQQVERLKTLGARTNKTLPATLIDLDKAEGAPTGEAEKELMLSRQD